MVRLRPSEVCKVLEEVGLSFELGQAGGRAGRSPLTYQQACLLVTLLSAPNLLSHTQHAHTGGGGSSRHGHFFRGRGREGGGEEEEEEGVVLSNRRWMVPSAPLPPRAHALSVAVEPPLSTHPR